MVKVEEINSSTCLDKSFGMLGAEAPRIYRQSAHERGLCGPNTGRLYPPPTWRHVWCSILLEVESTPSAQGTQNKFQRLNWKAAKLLKVSGVPRNFIREGWDHSTNSVEDRGQRERGSGGRQPPSQGFWRQL